MKKLIAKIYFRFLPKRFKNKMDNQQTKNQVIIIGVLDEGTGLSTHAYGIGKIIKFDNEIVNFKDIQSKDLRNKIHIVTCEPFRVNFEKDEGEYRIYMVVFESTRIPQSWVNILNKYANEVWVVAHWLKKVLEDSGVLTPIRIQEIGVEVLDNFEYKRERKDDYIFTCIAGGIDRKGILETIVAFNECQFNDDVYLRIHMRYGDEKYISRVKEYAKDNKQIQITEGYLNDGDYRCLWDSTNCLINLSKGEGFGLVPRQGEALGISGIISKIPAHEGCNIYTQVDTKRQKAYYEFTDEDCGFNWFPDLEDAKRLMNNQIDSWDKNKINPRRREWTKDWSWLSDSYNELLDKKIIVLNPNCNEICGVNFYMLNLMEEWDDVAFAKSYEEVVSLLNVFVVETVIIQHEHNMFDNDDTFINFINHIKQHPIKVVVILHTWRSNKQEFYNRIKEVAILITLNSISAAKHDAIYLEHGVKEVYLWDNERVNNGKLVTFGLASDLKKNKRLCQIASDLNCEVDIISVNERVRGEGVILDNNFYTDEELIKRVSEYTAIVFLRTPCEDIIGASGAVRLALNAQVPIYCEKSLFFYDIRDYIVWCPFDEIAPRIKKIMDCPVERHKLIAKQNEFLSIGHIDRISNKLREICKN
jgi:hypothetical protein